MSQGNFDDLKDLVFPDTLRQIRDSYSKLDIKNRLKLAVNDEKSIVKQSLVKYQLDKDDESIRITMNCTYFSLKGQQPKSSGDLVRLFYSNGETNIINADYS